MTARRTVTIHAAVDHAAAAHQRNYEADASVQSIEQVLEKFRAAVNAGCFGRLADPLDKLPTGTSIDFPPIHPGAFAVLARMAEASVELGSGVTAFRVDVEEDVATTLPEPEVRFPVRIETGIGAKHVDVAVEGRGLTAEAGARIAEAIQAWAGLLGGGFPTDEVPRIGTGLLSALAARGDAVVATVDFFRASPQCWKPLQEALSCIHEDSAIESLELEVLFRN